MAQPASSSRPSPTAKKRKEPPTNPQKAGLAARKKPKIDHRARQRDARVLSTQTTSKAFQNGALDVSAFVKAREFEIQALDQGIQRSGAANNRRAFQQVPHELRRRTASHNAKRIPKRLRKRAEKEMIEDNTPIVTARRRKPTPHMRLRLETLKKLRALGAREKVAKTKTSANLQRADASEDARKVADAGTPPRAEGIRSRKPKLKKQANLAKPPTPKAKFRKRQIHKSWLPTHLFHTKRAHMTPPSAPLWRFMIPLTPTQKGYRSMHRAASERGAVAWDISYLGTIALEGREASIETVLKGLGVDVSEGGQKWKQGKSVWDGWAHDRESKQPIAPITVIWCAFSSEPPNQVEATTRRKAFIRVHPSAFLQLWEQVLRLAKVAKPPVTVEDLRFEIGSVQITGPGSTEALLGALWPVAKQGASGVEHAWTSLAGLTDPSALPSGTLVAFDIQDPRLHHPPRTVKLPQTQSELDMLLELTADWPGVHDQSAPSIFNRTDRQEGSKLPSQKAINRRKTLAPPGAYPAAIATDPRIPILIYNTPRSKSPSAHGNRRSFWTLLGPWKAIQPIWYSIQYYPLSTGLQPRFGGLNEQRQLAFEAGQPWFPADFPGTEAGWAWEMIERKKRLEDWERRPRSKRISWERVGSTTGSKGEIGRGYACDWDVLLTQSSLTNGEAEVVEIPASKKKQDGKDGSSEQPPKARQLTHAPFTQASEILKQTYSTSADLCGKLMTVRLILVTRGTPQTCARIYRLPSASKDPELRKAWLALQPSEQKRNGKTHHSKNRLPKLPTDAPAHILERRLAQSLLQPAQAGEDTYPGCPGQDDLIGFATTGNFSLAEGRGIGIGSLMIDRVVADVKAMGGQGRLCIVRNAGESIGRLAKWEVV